MCAVIWVRVRIRVRRTYPSGLCAPWSGTLGVRPAHIGGSALLQKQRGGAPERWARGTVGVWGAGAAKELNGCSSGLAIPTFEDAC